MAGIYVHIPFCVGKCLYCDFHSIVADAEIVGNYLVALEREIDYYGGKLASYEFATVFIGGGTPTILSTNQLVHLISIIRKKFNLSNECEFSIEANPKTLTKSKIRALIECGVNRLSIGVQSFQDDLLKRIGRIHTVKDAWKTIGLLHTEGINNFNIDLIYGLPGQTNADWLETLEQTLSAEPKHISAYSLIVENETPFALEQQKGILYLPSEDEEVTMFAKTKQILEENSFTHYEISNYALPGYECRHNINYWRNKPYLGLGSGAHGYWCGIRYANSEKLTQYIDSWLLTNGSKITEEEINLELEMDETMMLGLRMLEGVAEREFSQRFGISYLDVYRKEIEKLQKQGLLKYDNGNLKLTERGLYLGNQVFAAFIR